MDFLQDLTVVMVPQTSRSSCHPERSEGSQRKKSIATSPCPLRSCLCGLCWSFPVGYQSVCYSNCNTTISGLDPNRTGGPHVPAPLLVYTSIFPIRLSPYT